MGWIRDTLLTAAIGAALSAPNAAAETAPSLPPTAPAVAPATTPPPAPPAPAAPPASAAPSLQHGATLEAPGNGTGASQGGRVGAKPKPPPSGGTAAGKHRQPPRSTPAEHAQAPQGEPGGTPTAPPSPGPPLSIPSPPWSTCAETGVPPALIPIYRSAAAAYALGPEGPAVLAAINKVETAFGANLNVSSAGAVGWMQFMPSTWEAYGVDADGNGVRDPYDPEDAIFTAARYLSAAGMPADTYGAVYAYNHADWYVAQVLADAGCYGSAVGGGAGEVFSLSPRLQVLSCRPAPGWRREAPPEYMQAFEEAAARYGLGRRGVWTLAAVARLESDFGRGMNERQLRRRGPLGLDASEWRSYAVDGDGDGRIRHADPADSAATLARLIWSRGGLRAGIFSHNHAAWYVQAVLGEADRMAGRCRVGSVDWAVALPGTAGAPIRWANLTLSNELERRDLLAGAVDPRIVGLIGAITQQHAIVISSLRSDHSKLTAEGNVSNHYFGRAMDIAAVDGVSCADTAVDAPCADLGRTLAYLPAEIRPTELIYCFDLDGPGPAFARADHCDHLHVGYDG